MTCDCCRSGANSENPINCTRRLCRDNSFWQQIGKTICKAPYLEKKQCFNMQGLSWDSCDQTCQTLYGQDCRKSGDDQLICCPEKTDLDSIWSWGLYQWLRDESRLRFLPAACFRNKLENTPTPSVCLTPAVPELPSSTPIVPVQQIPSAPGGRDDGIELTVPGSGTDNQQ